ncbi:MAG: MFS transporter [Hyphomicrobiaceae bacterium]|nr:MFS transporter [Hyphomicrobiaceae bacterium]
MPPTWRERAQSPETRTSAYYFTLFMTAGVANAYAGIWMADRGLSADQIGTVFTAPLLLLLLLNQIVGRVADRASDWRQTILIGAAISGLAGLGLFWSDGFWPLLLVWGLANVGIGAVMPVTDAATMRMSRRRKSEYSTIRAWGTAGYLLAIVVTGFAIAHFGAVAFVPLFVAAGFWRAGMAQFLPRFRAADPSEVKSAGARRLMSVIRPWFILPIIGWSLVFATHLLLNGFQSLLFAKQGISTDVIGLLIATGAFSEAVLFFVFRRFAQRFPARYLLVFSAAITVVRWAAMSLSPDVPLLFGLQLLHGFTFAVGFMGSVRFVADWTSEDIAAEAQGFSQTMQGAIGVIATYSFGWLAELYGAHAYLASALLAAAGGLCVILSLMLRGVRTEAAHKLSLEEA